MQLYNTLSTKECEKLIERTKKNRLTISFYRYTNIYNPKDFRDQLFINFQKLNILGRIYVSKEGINAQISIPSHQIKTLENYLNSIVKLKDIRLNTAIEQNNKSFLKLTIKVKNKIVSDGLNDACFDVTNKGTQLRAKEFNNFIEDKNTILVDVRNHYETEIGHFKNALLLDIDTFRESLPLIETQLQKDKKDKNLLLYCTGGIRCEKASAYFKHKGFKNVYQLEGGIINYANQVKDENLENKFIGKNFVFDQRKSEHITNDVIAQCHQCGTSCDTHVNCANDGCHLLFIQCLSCAKKMGKTCSYNCKKIIELPLIEQKKLRKGVKNSNKVFKKGRSQSLIYKK